MRNSISAFLGGLLLISASLCWDSALAQFPIPQTYDGFPLVGKKTQTHPVVLEAFFDLLCPDCAATWPILKEVAAHYGRDAVQVIVHPFPAPFHHNAFFAARGMHIAASLNGSAAYAWMELVYDHQDAYSNAATSLESPAGVIERLAKLGTKIGLNEDDILKGFEDSSSDKKARISFKYGCNRAVTGTPTFLVNGAPVAGAYEWGVSDWKDLVDRLLGEKTGSRDFF